MTEEKVIQKNIDYFIKRVEYYFYKIFHLYDYELEITVQDKVGARATSYWHRIEDGSGMITISYTEEWINDETLEFEEIDKIAFHEVSECLLSELQQLINARFISEKDIPNAVHRVIRRLENSVFLLVKDNKRENENG